MLIGAWKDRENLKVGFFLVKTSVVTINRSDLAEIPINRPA